MSTHIKHCGCAWCRVSMRKKPVKAYTRKALRGARNRWNLTARQQDQDKATAPVSLPPPG